MLVELLPDGKGRVALGVAFAVVPLTTCLGVSLKPSASSGLFQYPGGVEQRSALVFDCCEQEWWLLVLLCRGIPPGLSVHLWSPVRRFERYGGWHSVLHLLEVSFMYEVVLFGEV
ncbi:hypothetical protein CEXT_625111 [Caerostris extrusa]|uniref:Secreted protein n=1 Tax=Caerostris extrusa TaxID=172846 RepID=A0AAV4XU58_CAEEX|nr:hypothetical protein CEXT_625111 [Caerostris extrusa]